MNCQITFYQLNISMPEDESYEIKQALDSLESLTAKIPGIIRVQCGKVINHSSGYSHCVMVEAESFDAMNAYDTNEEKIKATKKLEQYEQPIVMFEYVTKKAE